MNFLVQAHHQGGSLWQSRILFYHLICFLQGKICRHEGWSRRMDPDPGDPLWDTHMQSSQRAPSLIWSPLKKNMSFSIVEAYKLSHLHLPKALSLLQLKRYTEEKLLPAGEGLTPNCLDYQELHSLFVAFSFGELWTLTSTCPNDVENILRLLTINQCVAHKSPGFAHLTITHCWWFNALNLFIAMHILHIMDRY